MSATDKPFITSSLSFLTYADMEAFDCSALSDGAIAYVREGITDIDAPVNTDRPTWIYSSTSVAAEGADVRGTANSIGATLRGRWLRVTGAPNIAP